MALVVEDGTGSNASANSFAALAVIKAYLAARGIAAPSDATIEVAAIEAMDYIASKESRLQGTRVSATQPLCYPRTGVVVFTFDIAENVVPVHAINAQCQLTADSLSGIPLMPNTTSAPIKREKVGSLETEYAIANGELASPVLAKAEAFLEPLYRAGGFSLKTYRA